MFDGPTDWLASADAIIAEFHPALVNCARIVETISKHGFDYIRSNSVFPGNMDCFKSVGPFLNRQGISVIAFHLFCQSVPTELIYNAGATGLQPPAKFFIIE